MPLIWKIPFTKKERCHPFGPCCSFYKLCQRLWYFLFTLRPNWRTYLKSFISPPQGIINSIFFFCASRTYLDFFLLLLMFPHPCILSVATYVLRIERNPLILRYCRHCWILKSYLLFFNIRSSKPVPSSDWSIRISILFCYSALLTAPSQAPSRKAIHYPSNYYTHSALQGWYHRPSQFQLHQISGKSFQSSNPFSLSNRLYMLSFSTSQVQLHRSFRQ